jgi:hypothetical protein
MVAGFGAMAAAGLCLRLAAVGRPRQVAVAVGLVGRDHGRDDAAADPCGRQLGNANLVVFFVVVVASGGVRRRADRVRLRAWPRSATSC